MTFPLLRLPLLASIKVINQIDIKKLISFIRLSKRANILVKRSNVPIKLTFFHSSIGFQKLEDRVMGERLEFFDMSAWKPTDIPFKPPCHLNFVSRIHYQIAAYKKVMDDFVEFFKVRSISFELESVCSYTSLCYLKYAKALGLKFTSARVVIGGSNGRVYQDLLKICSTFSQLLVLFETEETFEFNGFNEYMIHKFCFVNKNRDLTDWFTVDHMCALINCLDVSVLNLNWSDEDFNRFLKFWMTSNGRLQSLVIWIWNWRISPQVVMNGIENRQLGNQEFEIQRADGVKAVVECYLRRFSLNVIDA